MHNASNTKKSNDVSVRLSKYAWDKIGEFTKETKLKKKQQVDAIVEEHDKKRKHLKGGSNKN
jgi:RNA:NAD 2'-phosphotransferase (TPT1/KptA family)